MGTKGFTGRPAWPSFFNLFWLAEKIGGPSRRWLYPVLGFACLAASLLVGPAYADSDIQEIESIYSKRYKSAGYLYLYGMRSGRALDFKAFDSSGESLDINLQEAKWLQFFSRTLKAEWEGKITEFKFLNDNTVECHVSDTLSGTLRNPGYSKKAKHVFKTSSIDTWSFKDGLWEQKSTRVLEQIQTLSPIDKQVAK